MFFFGGVVGREMGGFESFKLDVGNESMEYIEKKKIRSSSVYRINR